MQALLAHIHLPQVSRFAFCRFVVFNMPGLAALPMFSAPYRNATASASAKVSLDYHLHRCEPIFAHSYKFSVATAYCCPTAGFVMGIDVWCMLSELSRHPCCLVTSRRSILSVHIYRRSFFLSVHHVGCMCCLDGQLSLAIQNRHTLYTLSKSDDAIALLKPGPVCCEAQMCLVHSQRWGRGCNPWDQGYSLLEKLPVAISVQILPSSHRADRICKLARRLQISAWMPTHLFNFCSIDTSICHNHGLPWCNDSATKLIIGVSFAGLPQLPGPYVQHTDCPADCTVSLHPPRSHRAAI